MSAEVDAVRSVIESYVRGSREGDAALLRGLFHPDAVMMGYMGGQLLSGSPEPFFQHADGSPQDDSYEGSVGDLRVDGDVATATLYERGFSGLDFVDHFHLLREEGTWRITSKIFHHS
ncbi:MAG: nuclear transport factor 2 family protein [Acidobacteriota bacterium]